MAIQNEKFSLLVSDSSGNPLTGSLVELRKDATIYTTTEVGNGWYSIASIPTGKYSVFVDSVDTGETKAVGSGQVAALGNTADNVPVSNATEYDFQDPTTLKTTLSLENVANVAVPSPTGSDENKVIQVDSNGDYVLSSIATSGFESVYEVLTTSDLSVALSAEYDSKLIVITREDFNFTNAQTFEVWGSCSIIVANTSESFQWSSNAVNATFNLKSGADSSLTGMFFLNGVIAFGDNSDYTLNIPWKVTNLDFISPEVSRSVDGSSTLTYESLKASIPASVTVTTDQDWWQNSASTGGADTQIQFNDGGVFGGDAGLTYNKTTNKLSVGGDVDVDGDVSTTEINVYNQQIAQNRGITSLWNTDGSTQAQRYVTLKQQDTYARITAGSAALAAANELRIEVADSSGTEQLIATFTDSKVSINDVLNLASTTTPASPTTGDIWSDGVKINIEAGLKVKRGNNANSTLDILNSSDASVIALYADADGDGQLIVNNNSAGQVLNVDSDANNGYHMLLNGVYRLGSTTNATPTNGDIWYDGTNVNIQGLVNLRSQTLLGANYVDIEDSTGWGVRVDGTNDALRPLVDNNTELGLSIRRWSKLWSTDGDFSGNVDVGGNLNITDTTDPTFQMGEVDTTNNAGYKILVDDSSGNVHCDHKTETSGTILYRCGQGTETGEARTFMSVNPSNADVFMGSNLNVNGVTNLSDVLNLASTTNASPSDGDIWRDSSDGKLKFRENGITYNFN